MLPAGELVPGLGSAAWHAADTRDTCQYIRMQPGAQSECVMLTTPTVFFPQGWSSGVSPRVRRRARERDHLCILWQLRLGPNMRIVDSGLPSFAAEPSVREYFSSMDLKMGGSWHMSVFKAGGANERLREAGGHLHVPAATVGTSRSVNSGRVALSSEADPRALCGFVAGGGCARSRSPMRGRGDDAGALVPDACASLRRHRWPGSSWTAASTARTQIRRSVRLRSAGHCEESDRHSRRTRARVVRGRGTQVGHQDAALPSCGELVRIGQDSQGATTRVRCRLRLASCAQPKIAQLDRIDAGLAGPSRCGCIVGGARSAGEGHNFHVGRQSLARNRRYRCLRRRTSMDESSQRIRQTRSPSARGAPQSHTISQKIVHSGMVLNLKAREGATDFSTSCHRLCGPLRLLGLTQLVIEGLAPGGRHRLRGHRSVGAHEPVARCDPLAVRPSQGGGQYDVGGLRTSSTGSTMPANSSPHIGRCASDGWDLVKGRAQQPPP